ncbi:helix-turn-helix transcriptional regulator [Streptacidiphilus sp. 4-A2]|nr:helix-turn-helix transcriptional regulator [Streptacidiphilus sp. 4-A2]
MTLRALAAKAGVSYSLLTKVTSGNRQATPELVTAVARALGVTTDLLQPQAYCDAMTDPLMPLMAPSVPHSTSTTSRRRKTSSLAPCRSYGQPWRASMTSRKPPSTGPCRGPCPACLPNFTPQHTCSPARISGRHGGCSPRPTGAVTRSASPSGSTISPPPP